MDPVSRLLLEREQAVPSRAPWMVAAVMVHLVAVGAAILLSRVEPSPPPHLPVVSVRLVAPRLRESTGGGSGRSAPRAEQPKPKPEPPAQVVPEPPPEPPPATAEIKASDKAMAATETPELRPTPVPAPATGGGDGSEQTATSGGRPASGLSLGGAQGGGGQPAIPADFQFGYYVERMLALIESKWYRPPVPAGTHAQVRFTITTSGRLEAVELEKSSAVPSFDRAVLRAMYAANPLPPLPPAYRKPSLTVHLTFAR